MNLKDKILIIKSNSLITKTLSTRFNKFNYYNVIENNNLDITNEKAIDFYIKNQNPDIIFLGFNNKDLQQKFITICNNYNIKKIYRFSNEKLDINSKIPIISYYTDNVYGLDDNYSFNSTDGNCFDDILKDRHIISYLFRKIHDAKIYKIPNIYLNYRSTQILFIHIDDLMSHIFKISTKQNTTIDYKILEKTTIPLLIRSISEIIEYDGRVIFNYNDFEIIENSYLKTYTIEKLRYLYRDLLIYNKNFNVMEFVN